MSLGSSVVRTSNWSSEGCGFDPRLGLRNHFLSIELEDRSSTLALNMLNFMSNDGGGGESDGTNDNGVDNDDDHSDDIMMTIIVMI